MKLTFKLFSLCFVINFLRCSSQSVSIIGSRFVTHNSTYKAYVLSNGLNKNSQIEVAFGSKGGEQKIVKNVDQSPFEELSFNVSPEDFSEYELRMSTKMQNICQQQSVNLITTSNIPIVFIQFNKPIYKKSEIFDFRILILSQKLLPISKLRQMSITIANPRRVVWSHDKVSEVSKYGVYENSIKLLDIPNFGPNDLGIWTIKVEVDGKIASKSFEVQNIKKDEIDVFVQIPEKIAFQDRKIYVNIFTKNLNKRFAAISLSAKFVNSSRVEIDKHVKSEYLTGPKTTIMLDYQQDLGIKFPTKDMILTFKVDIVQDNKLTTVIKEVEMKYKERHTIQVVRKKYFKPGFKFPIKVRVKLLNGVSDNSFNQLSTTVKYLSTTKNGMTNEEEKKYETNLKNGDTFYALQPKSKTIKILLQMKFADTVYMEEIDRFPGVDEYMQVTMLNKSSTVGSTVQIKVQSTEEMEELHLLIFSTKGIIHSEPFDKAVGKDVFDFPLELTDEMRPEARGLVFYTRAIDGAMIYDEFSLSIGFSIDNSLEISAPDKAEPNEVINVKVKTEKDSQVFIVAIDVNADLYNGDNGINRTSVYSEIAYHINRKFTNDGYHFEKLNAFILEPLKNGQNCDTDRKIGKDDKELLESPSTDVSFQKYFPDTIPELNFIATSDIQTVQIKMPDSATTWKIYGISVHPTKGFTVAKTNPEISVKGMDKKGIQLAINSPSKVYQEEIHKIEIVTKLMQNSNLNGVLTIDINDGLLLNEKIAQKSWNINCRNYEIYKTPIGMNVQLTPQKYEDIKYFYVKPNGAKPMKITAKFVSGATIAEAVSDILVEGSEKLRTEVVASNLIELNQKTPKFQLKLPNNAAAIKTFVTVHGNLIGPALNGLEIMFGRQMFLDEEKILKFQAAIINYKFLESIGQSTKEKVKDIKREILEGGNEAVEILRTISKDKTKLWFSAFIIRTLKDSENLYDIDNKLIYESLDFIASQQSKGNYQNKEKGSFDYYPDFDDHKDIGAGMRKYIQNALIIAAFSKDSKFTQRYKITIENSLNYLISKSGEFRGDPVNVVVAYAFALFGNNQVATEFIKKLNHGYAKTGAVSLKKHYSMYVEVISYLILTKILIKEDPRIEVERLLAHRKVDGSFYSPYDTVLALKALYEYSRYRNNGKSFVIEIDGQPNMIGKDESKQFGPFSDPRHELIITTQGLGYTIVHQDFSDNAASKNSISSLITSVKKVGNSNDLGIFFDYKFLPSELNLNSNLLVLEVEVPKGYSTRANKKNFQDVEFRNNGSTVVFYSHNIKTGSQYKDSMTLTRNKNVLDSHKFLTIKLYDYYRPNIVDMYTYDLLCIQN